MLCRELIEQIEKIFPRTYALSWDNVGLLAGRQEKEVKKIYLALDADDAVVESAIEEGADLLLTHHPLIFSGIKKVTDEDFIGRRLVKLIQNDLCYYAMHTNYDVLAMAKKAAKRIGMSVNQVLEETKATEEETFGIGLVGQVEECAAEELCEQLKTAFTLPGIQLFGDKKQKVKRIAICPGSGKSLIQEAVKKHVDVFVTGDIGHHEGIDAVAEGMLVIDVGHYGMEHIFVEDMKECLEQQFSDLTVLTAPIHYPYHIL